jgi:uncharacterized membrane protein YkoI
MGLSAQDTGVGRPTGRIVAVGLTGAMLGTVLTLALAGTGNDGVSAPEGVAVQTTVQQEQRDPAATPAPAPAPAPTEAPAPAGSAGQLAAPPSPADGVAAPDPGPAAPDGAITAEQAGRIAVALVGGSVDTIHPEDGDHGAAWDVDVYAPDGEYTIYVSSAGEVVRVDGPYRD